MTTMSHVITAFYSSAALLGVPSLAGLIVSSMYAVFAPRVTDAPYMSVRNPDAVLLVLTGMARVLQFFARIVGSVGKLMIRAVAAFSVAGVVVAVTLFLTARGLNDQQDWARIAALITSGCGFLLIAVAFITTRGLLRLSCLLLAAVVARVLWIVWLGYI